MPGCLGEPRLAYGDAAEAHYHRSDLRAPLFGFAYLHDFSEIRSMKFMFHDFSMKNISFSINISHDFRLSIIDVRRLTGSPTIEYRERVSLVQ